MNCGITMGSMTESKHREYFTEADERWVESLFCRQSNNSPPTISKENYLLNHRIFTSTVNQKGGKEDIKSTVRKLEDENELAMERVWEKGEFYQRLRDKSKQTTDKG